MNSRDFFIIISKKSLWNFDKLTCFEYNIFVFYFVIKNMGDFNENKIWFDGEKYIELQRNQINDRLVNTAWRLYLEIDSLIKNEYAQEVLPGYSPDTMKKVFGWFKDKIEILISINSEDIINDTKIWEDNLSLWDFIEHRLLVLERNFWTKPVLVITNIDVWNMFDLILNFERRFQKKQYRVFEKYKISWYPYNLKSMLSEDGFGADDHIPLTKNLILVTWIGQNSGKFSTCLWQIYLDNEIWIRAWYAKFQTFPIWNLPLDHPINLAYEAMNLSNWNKNIVDWNHKKSYNQDAITTSWDSESFEILQNFAKETVNHKNYMIKYNSSIDMSINCTWMCISDENAINSACINEIEKLKSKYESLWGDILNKLNEIYEKALQRKK